MRKSLLAAAALAVSTLCTRAVAQAQEEPVPKPPPPRPQEEPVPPPPGPREDTPPAGPEKGGRPVDPTAPDFLGAAFGDISEQILVGDERVFAATGTLSQPVWVKLPGLEVRCESIVVWGDRDQLEKAVARRREVLSGADPDTILGPIVHALYAEGAVYVKMNKQTVRAEKLFLDFQRGKAYFVKAQMTAELEGKQRRPVPLTIRADVVRATARDKYRAQNAQFTTCRYADPHFELATDTLEVDYTKEFASFSTGWWPTVRMETLAGKETPIFTFPMLGGDTAASSIPVQAVGVSHGSRFGSAYEVTWGGRIPRDDGSKWGDWRLHTDERTRRGPGVGVDLIYDGHPSRPGGPTDEFELSAYWQRDRQEFDGFSDRAFDGGKNPSGSDRNRGFAQLWSRWFVEDDAFTRLIGEGWRVDSKVSYSSDRGYLAEYDHDKVEMREQQDTFVHARQYWGNQGASFLASYRLNDAAAALDREPSDLLFTDYENQTQYLPSGTYHLINQPLLVPPKEDWLPTLNLSIQANAANLKRRYDDRLANRIEAGLGWRGRTVQRGDLESRITAPFSLGDVHVNPAVGGSALWESDANGFLRPDDGPDGRTAAFWDLRSDVQAWKLYPDAKSSWLDVDGIRHVASLDAQYFDRFHVSDGPASFQPNDPVEDLSEVRTGSVRLRNRLETKRDGEVVDWLDYEARFLYFFDAVEAPPYPALLGLREDFPQPLQNLDFPGEAKYLSSARDGSAYWQHRARLQFMTDLWLVGEADYDLGRGAMETSAVGLRWAFDRRASLYVGRRTIHSDSTVWTQRFDYRLSNRWGVEVELQEDSKASRGLRKTFVLYRRAHDYTIAVEFRDDDQTDDRAVSLAIYPNDWLTHTDDPFSRRRSLDYDAMKWYR